MRGGRASEWRVLALRLGMWDMIGFWQVISSIPSIKSVTEEVYL